MENQLNMFGVCVAGTMLRVMSLYRVVSKKPLNPCMTQSRDTAKESLPSQRPLHCSHGKVTGPTQKWVSAVNHIR